MHNLVPHSNANAGKPFDLTTEVARLEALLSVRRQELTVLQEEFRVFKARYTQIVGSCLSELAEVERAIKEAEARLLGVDVVAEEEAVDDDVIDAASSSANVSTPTSLRRLFWSIAKVFHPDHAANEGEARRRHTIMAEASRAYREGDADSLHTLLGDEQLQAYCANSHARNDEDDLAQQLVRLKDDLRTVEFGIKRLRQDRLYHLKLKVDEDAVRGQDALSEMAATLRRQITKARHRLENLM